MSAGAIGPGTWVAGKYELQQQLGRGGFGTVFRARHDLLGSDVALKLMNPEVAENKHAEQRFLREVKSSSAIVHKYAVQLRDFGRDRELGCLYFTMDLVRGSSLKKVIEDEGRLDPARVVRVGAQVLEVLAEAHDAGLIHRDLKPGNLMLTRERDGDEAVRVLDFGIAKAISSAQGAQDAGLTMAGTTVGTLPYMSPEQAQGLQLAGTSDVYSLGVVLYEALTGQRPIAPHPEAADPRQSMLFQIVASPPRPLRELAPWVPAELAAVVMRALAKSAGERPANAAAMREELLRAGAAVSSASPSPSPSASPSPRPSPRPSPSPSPSSELTESFGMTGAQPVAPTPSPELTESFGMTGAQPVAPRPSSTPTPSPELTESFGMTGAQPVAPSPTPTPSPELTESFGLTGAQPVAPSPTPTPSPELTESFGLTGAQPVAPAPQPGRIGDTIAVPLPDFPPVSAPPSAGADAFDPAAMAALLGGDTSGAQLDALMDRLADADPSQMEAVFAAMAAQDGLSPADLGPPPQPPAPSFTPPPSLPPGVRPGTEPGEFLHERDGTLLVWLPPGRFEMGAYGEELYLRPPDGRAEYTKRPSPRTVTLTQGAFIGKFPVTWNQYARFCREDGRALPNHVIEVHGQVAAAGDHPAYHVSWEDAQAYCQWAGLRLPTEAEWEYATRGTEGCYYPWGYGDPDRSRVNHGSGNAADPRDATAGLPCTSPVKTFPQSVSPFGCWDTLGNTWEWVADWAESDAVYHETWDAITRHELGVDPLAASESQIGEAFARMQRRKELDPRGPARGVHRVCKGGSWMSPPVLCHGGARRLLLPAARLPDVGFRAALSLA